MANLLVRIRNGKAVSTSASEENVPPPDPELLDRVRLSLSFPPWVQVASKVGAVDHSRSEVALVNAPSGDYVFCIITKDQADTTWEPPNEGWNLIRSLSALLWKRFEPGHPWPPGPGAERFKP